VASLPARGASMQTRPPTPRAPHQLALRPAASQLPPAPRLVGVCRRPPTHAQTPSTKETDYRDSSTRCAGPPADRSPATAKGLVRLANAAAPAAASLNLQTAVARLAIPGKQSLGCIDR